MKNKYFKNINFNKWHKNMPDCQIRALCAAIGIDYEVACKKLNVKCIPGQGFNDEYGIDLDTLLDTFRPFFGKMEDMLDKVDDPIQALTNGQTLNSWLEEHKDDNCKYLVYLDDNKVNDGGHIVCAYCMPGKLYFVDTFDCGNMFVQAWAKVNKILPKASKYHWKYDNSTRQFV